MPRGLSVTMPAAMLVDSGKLVESTIRNSPFAVFLVGSISPGRKILHTRLYREPSNCLPVTGERLRKLCRKNEQLMLRQSGDRLPIPAKFFASTSGGVWAPHSEMEKVFSSEKETSSTSWNRRENVPVAPHGAGARPNRRVEASAFIPGLDVGDSSTYRHSHRTIPSEVRFAGTATRLLQDCGSAEDGGKCVRVLSDDKAALCKPLQATRSAYEFAEQDAARRRTSGPSRPISAQSEFNTRNLVYWALERAARWLH